MWLYLCEGRCVCCEHSGLGVKCGSIPMREGVYVASIEARVFNMVISLCSKVGMLPT